MTADPPTHAIKAAVVFHRFGPYHCARLEAAASRMKILAVEVFAEQASYPWERVSGAGSFEHVTLFPGAKSAVSRRQLRPRLFDCLDRFKPDVVLIPGWGNLEAWAALSWCSSRGVAAVVMSESTAWDERRTWWKEEIKRRLVSLTSTALVGGHPQGDYLVQLGMPRDRVFYGYDSVDNDYFGQKARLAREREAENRAAHALPQNYFLACARFVEKKNLFRLLKAYARYCQLCGKPAGKNEAAMVPWSLVLLGDGPLRASIEKQIDALHLRDRVLLPGFRQYDDLPVYYAMADAFIHASTVEQWGLVVNEAMASGLPVLVSNRCGCVFDLVRRGSNGFIFDPIDIEEMAGHMQRISRMEKGARQTMGSEGERIVAAWGPARFAEGLDAAVHRALQEKPPQGGRVHRLLLRGLLIP